MFTESFTSIGQIIQLSVAPAFLLVAVGSFMNVATTRLGRVVDRARILEDIIGHHRDEEYKHRYLKELEILNARMISINLSIMFATFAALLVCFVVALLFVSVLMAFNASLFLALIFIATMIMLVIALLFFLSEIMIARKSLRVHGEYLKKD